MKKLFLILVLGLLWSGSAYAKKEKIEGSSLFYKGKIEVVRNVEINNLKIKFINWYHKEACKGKTPIASINFSGNINPDATAVVKTLLEEAKNSSCEGLVTVTLNSEGGYLKDGFEIGRLFREYNVYAQILEGSVCASACSTAFLGGFERYMMPSAKILVHRPYFVTNKNTIECISEMEAEKLKNYYVEMIGNIKGNLLYDRTMGYCSASKGWTLNGDAAYIFGFLTADPQAYSSK